MPPLKLSIKFSNEKNFSNQPLSGAADPFTQTKKISRIDCILVCRCLAHSAQD